MHVSRILHQTHDHPPRRCTVGVSEGDSDKEGERTGSGESRRGRRHSQFTMTEYMKDR